MKSYCSEGFAHKNSCAQEKFIAVHDQPHVGVIVCTMNKPAQLQNALCCIQNQNYKNLTVVVVDDMSECKSLNSTIVHNFPGTLHYLCNEQRLGIARSRNRGMQYMMTSVRPDLICTLDDDDHWPINRLIIGIESMRSPTIGMSYGIQWMTDGYLRPIIKYPCKTNYTKARLHALFCGEFFFPAKTYMFARPFLEELQIEPLNWYIPHNSREDVELGIRALRHATKSQCWQVVFVDHLLAHWVQSDGIAKFSTKEHLQRLFTAHEYIVKQYLPKWTHNFATTTAPYLYRLPHWLRFAIV